VTLVFLEVDTPLETAVPAAPEETPGHQVLLAIQVVLAILVLLALPETPANQLALLAKPSSHLHANPAQLVLPANLVLPVNPVIQVPMVLLDKVVETQLPALLVLKVHPAPLVLPAILVNLAAPANQPPLNNHNRDHLDLLVMPASQVNLDPLANLVMMVNPVDLDPKDPLVLLDLPDNPVMMVSLATPANLVKQATKVSARNTVPSMVESSSKMEQDDKSLPLSEELFRTIHTKSICRNLYLSFGTSYITMSFIKS